MADIEVGDDVIANAKELARIRREMAKLKKDETQLRDSILSVLGKSERALTGSGFPVVHIERQERRGVNKDRLEAMYPEVFEAVLETSEVKILKVDIEGDMT